MTYDTADTEQHAPATTTTPATAHASVLAFYAAVAVFGAAGMPVVTWQDNPFLFLFFPALLWGGGVGAFIYTVASFLPDLADRYYLLKNERQAAEVAPVTIHTPTPQNAPQRPNLPTVVPLRETREVEFAAVAEEVTIIDGWLQTARRSKPLPRGFNSQWLVTIRAAAMSGQLPNISGAKLHDVGISRFESVRGGETTPAAWCIDLLETLEYISKKGQVYEWTTEGARVFSPALSYA